MSRQSGIDNDDGVKEKRKMFKESSSSSSSYNIHTHTHRNVCKRVRKSNDRKMKRENLWRGKNTEGKKYRGTITIRRRRKANRESHRAKIERTNERRKAANAAN